MTHGVNMTTRPWRLFTSKRRDHTRPPLFSLSGHPAFFHDATFGCLRTRQNRRHGLQALIDCLFHRRTLPTVCEACREPTSGVLSEAAPAQLNGRAAVLQIAGWRFNVSRPRHTELGEPHPLSIVEGCGAQCSHFLGVVEVRETL